MKVGDLVKITECSVSGYSDFVCECFFCSRNSNRIGLVTGPASRNSWRVMFDCGEWRVDDFDEAQGLAKVINASR